MRQKHKALIVRTQKELGFAIKNVVLAVDIKKECITTM